MQIQPQLHTSGYQYWLYQWFVATSSAWDNMKLFCVSNSDESACHLVEGETIHPQRIPEFPSHNWKYTLTHTHAALEKINLFP